MAKILVIDDEELIRFAMREMVESSGHHVEEAEDGAAGLACLGRGGIDLVITDIVMPNMEGIQTITEIRKIDPEVPILAISGSGRIGASDRLAESRKAGADAVLKKPFSDKELQEKIASLLAT